MTFKTRAQLALRKTLETVDKGLKTLQDHPVAVERTVLVLTTIFFTRAAVKKFSPVNSVSQSTIDSIAKTSSMLDKLEARNQFKLLRPVDPEPYDAEWVNEIFHLEVTDADLWDMGAGMGMVYNVKDFDGTKNIPLALVNYEGLMKTLKKAGSDFPVNKIAEDLLKANKS